jgi:hypothetical protein
MEQRSSSSREVVATLGTLKHFGWLFGLAFGFDQVHLVVIAREAADALRPPSFDPVGQCVILGRKSFCKGEEIHGYTYFGDI